MEFTQDIMERLRAEERVRESESLFRTIFEQAAIGVAQLNSVSGVILKVNRRYREILSTSKESLVGKTWMDLTHPDDLAADLANMERLCAGEIREFSLEKRLQREDGSFLWVHLTVSPMWQPGEKPTTHIAIVQDITARKQAEEALRKSEEKLRELNASLEKRVAERTAELEETNADLAAFAHSVSHDLRAPLRAMEGFAAALAEDYGQQLDNNAREYIQHIGDAAKRMDRLVVDLLAYSQLGHRELHQHPIGLNLIVQDALNQIGLDVKMRDVELHVAEEMPKVLGHKATLVQVAANLLSNAMKFVAQGVRPKLHVWAETTEENAVRLWIVDNGIGIDDEYQDRIFSLFERLHGIESYPGTGVGLAIVARACERLGGRCGVESKPGEGSRFWVEFPGVGATT